MSNIPTSTPHLDRVASPADLKRLTDEELAFLAEELRQETIDVVSQTGGHLGSSLGVVELSVALHAVFNTPHDKLIWDVGHQCYPHKILTGRRDRMLTLRQANGLSGFTKRSESDFDPFGAAPRSPFSPLRIGSALALCALGPQPDTVGTGRGAARHSRPSCQPFARLGRRAGDQTCAGPVALDERQPASVVG